MAPAGLCPKVDRVAPVGDIVRGRHDAKLGLKKESDTGSASDLPYANVGLSGFPEGVEA